MDSASEKASTKQKARLKDPLSITESHRWTELLDFNKPSTEQEKQLAGDAGMLNKVFVWERVQSVTLIW